jgi:hypothetical protein
VEIFLWWMMGGSGEEGVETWLGRWSLDWLTPRRSGLGWGPSRAGLDGVSASSNTSTWTSSSTLWAR